VRARRGHAEAEQNRNEDHFQNVAFGKGVDHGGRDDVHQKVGNGLGLGLSRILGDGVGVERGWVHVEAAARMHDVAYHESDNQGKGRNDFKIEKGLAADAADLAQILHAGDASHHGQKIITVMIMVIMRMKPSPRGFMAMARAGLR